ncbi:hypothetical protein EYF80_049935 [Liparis tanakae]|uniref:Uncharacterized protein n=1 Tax=Liparis tanakae TaxID=230148 RepID=A0A4Z2FF99_9TELE|nr:hypothetical protein EYF80_049935 [Liparis tanakae]
MERGDRFEYEGGLGRRVPTEEVGGAGGREVMFFSRKTAIVSSRSRSELVGELLNAYEAVSVLMTRPLRDVRRSARGLEM